jgi:hypothetical protein
MKIAALLFSVFLSFATSTIAQDAIPRECEESAKGFGEYCNQRMECLYSQIIEKSKSGRCSTSAQCKTAGIGAKLCGGPAVYIPYSTSDMTEHDLLNKVSEYNKLSVLSAGHISRELGLASDCALVADPGADCVASECVLKVFPQF